MDSSNLNKSEFNSEIDLDLKELFLILWNGRKIITLFGIFFGLVALIISLNLPNIYQSKALYVPENDSDAVQQSSLLSQLGGMAGMAGIDLGGEGVANQISQTIAVMRSRKFIKKFILDNDLLVPLLASEGWNKKSNELLIDNSIYNAKTKIWGPKILLDDSKVPSLNLAYEKFTKEHLSLTYNSKDGFISISMNHFSPYIAKEWLEKFVNEINVYMRSYKVNEANRSIDYLKQVATNNSNNSIDKMFSNLIEQQYKVIMIANSKEEYALRTIDPPIIPERKSSPQRLVNIILGAILGSLIGIIFIFIRYFFYTEPVNYK